MNLAQRLADDYRHIDGVENVTLQPVAGDGAAGTPVTDVKGLRRHSRQTANDPRAAGAAIDTEAVVWHLWTSTLAGTSPRPGDQIQAGDGSVWTIQQAESQTLGTRWRITATRSWST